MDIIGIDPGKSGGIAWLKADGKGGHAFKMPDTERDILNELRPFEGDSFAYIELVGGMPRDVPANSFRFGVNYGGLRMALLASRISFETVTPAVWQREFKLPTLKKAGSSVKKKNAHKARAQELFPHLKITHAISDALLIAEWGRRQRRA